MKRTSALILLIILLASTASSWPTINRGEPLATAAEGWIGTPYESKCPPSILWNKKGPDGLY